MKTLNDEFIPYEEALVLKELGFNEPCFGLYNPIFHLNFGEKNNSLFYPKTTCSAPLYQQAFRWFREKYEMHYVIERITENEFSYHIYDHSLSKTKEYSILDNDEFVKTYEEAELACLKKLIEIVKNE